MNIKRISILSIIVISMLVLLSGCKWNNQEMARKVEKRLEEKYNQTFVTKSIGDRLDTKHTRLFCSPSNDDDILFEVTYYDDGTMVDDYVETKIENELEKELQKKLKEKNINSICKINIMAKGREKGKNYIDYEVNNYLKDVKVYELWISAMAIDTNNINKEKDAENIIKSLETFSKDHNDIEVLVDAIFVKNEDFDSVEKYFKSNPKLYYADSLEEYFKNSDNTEREVIIHINFPDVKVETSEYVEEIMEKTKVY